MLQAFWYNEDTKRNKGVLNMQKYVSIEKAIKLTEEAHECSLQPIPKKHIMFSGIKPSGETIILCSPQSKFNSAGRYWIDITFEQYKILDSYDNALLIVRLEGNHLLLFGWEELKIHLKKEFVRYNENEQYHWKLYIYPKYYQVYGSKEKIVKPIFQFIG